MKHPANRSPADDDAIDELAAGWVLQREEGLSMHQAAEFDRWCAADPRHAAAIARFEKTCGFLEKIPLLPAPEFSHEGSRVRREKRRVISFPGLKTISAMAAALVLLATLSLLPTRHIEEEKKSEDFNQLYATTADGYQRVMLPDGSVLELNASTEVRVNYSVAERSVSLLNGEAHFSVAKNPARPFVVSAGRVAVRAVGTAFNVRLDKAAVEVLVTEGKVQLRPTPPRLDANVSAAAEPAEPTPLLVAGERAVIPTDVRVSAPHVEKVEPVVVRETLAWQSPTLAFVDTPLSNVVEQFNRRNRLQLAVEDAELASRAVGGNFRADNVEAFLRLLQSSRDIHVDYVDADHAVLRKAR